MGRRHVERIDDGRRQRLGQLHDTRHQRRHRRYDQPAVAQRADATLLNHDGDGHQLKINKASASDTASLLYQDAFSGRAEMGLAGDDDFHFKVSPDGASWKEAIVIDRSTGIVAFPFTSLAGGRQVLAADLDLYVRADGSDGGGHTGLANTSGDAFLTLQKAVDVAVGYDLSIYKITIHVGAGTTYAGVILKSYIGVGPIIIEGDTTTPANVTINAPVTTGEALKAPACISTNGIRGKWRIRGLKFVSSRSGDLRPRRHGRVRPLRFRSLQQLPHGGEQRWPSHRSRQLCHLR